MLGKEPQQKTHLSFINSVPLEIIYFNITQLLTFLPYYLRLSQQTSLGWMKTLVSGTLSFGVKEILEDIWPILSLYR